MNRIPPISSKVQVSTMAECLRTQLAPESLRQETQLDFGNNENGDQLPSFTACSTGNCVKFVVTDSLRFV